MSIARIALIYKPVEIGEVMDEPEPRNRKRHRRMRTRGLEPGEKNPVERPSARAEIGKEITRGGAMNEPGVLKKAAMD
jgi:hypothetical protein